MDGFLEYLKRAGACRIAKAQYDARDAFARVSAELGESRMAGVKLDDFARAEKSYAMDKVDEAFGFMVKQDIISEQEAKSLFDATWALWKDIPQDEADGAFRFDLVAEAVVKTSYDCRARFDGIVKAGLMTYADRTDMLAAVDMVKSREAKAGRISAPEKSQVM